ncbi:hypothetical protein PISMIDRAFT_675103 [Pisolithus microcarpus 441]|uniref:Uncharacterized protein n=1 Tax=Pisolithus microcarpus 441 TaxID=765257 RepID=A0A0C9YQ94_9AGAM|nr:hypothetical protein PISMIDRAFT_675103 [Pisolithus microcarpus 441]
MSTQGFDPNQAQNLLEVCVLTFHINSRFPGVIARFAVKAVEHAQVSGLVGTMDWTCVFSGA